MVGSDSNDVICVIDDGQGKNTRLFFSGVVQFLAKVSTSIDKHQTHNTQLSTTNHIWLSL